MAKQIDAIDAAGSAVTLSPADALPTLFEARDKLRGVLENWR
jgi:hypothetical protein